MCLLADDDQQTAQRTSPRQQRKSRRDKQQHVTPSSAPVIQPAQAWLNFRFDTELILNAMKQGRQT